MSSPNHETLRLHRFNNLWNGNQKIHPIISLLLAKRNRLQQSRRNSKLRDGKIIINNNDVVWLAACPGLMEYCGHQGVTIARVLA
mmetsp:Transcript_36980/g.66534  ORF Transcript_36980/g.66534 Transcript_36980/m.66534 type:complete len:85 (+) Transcript_36980:518-772(+)